MATTATPAIAVIVKCFLKVLLVIFLTPRDVITCGETLAFHPIVSPMELGVTTHKFSWP